jgi:hypothetical protein
MTRLVRTLTERQLKAIGDNGLHALLSDDLKDEVAAALDAFAAGLSAHTVHLDEITLGLSGLLRQQGGVKKQVQEIVAIGGTELTESELYDAVASWIIDNQLGGGLEWDPQQRPQAH